MPDDSPDAEPLQVRVLLPDGGELVERGGEESDGDDGESEGEAADDRTETEDEDGKSDEAASGQEERDDEVELSEDESSDEGGDEQEGDESTAGDAAEDGEDQKGDEEAGTNILQFSLDGLVLDLLGLEVDLDQVTLDLTARTGEGNLLGNLLSAVSGLLDGGELGDLLSLGGGDGDGESGSLLSGLLPSMPDWPDLHPIERARHLASALADRIRELVDDVIGSLPIEALLAQFMEELVDQLVNGATDDDESGEAAGS